MINYYRDYFHEFKIFDIKMPIVTYFGSLWGYSLRYCLWSIILSIVRNRMQTHFYHNYQRKYIWQTLRWLSRHNRIKSRDNTLSPINGSMSRWLNKQQTVHKQITDHINWSHFGRQSSYLFSTLRSLATNGWQTDWYESVDRSEQNLFCSSDLQ